MVNALKIIGDILAVLPKTEWSPEVTEGREGFIHALRMDGLAEKATIEFLIRDFNIKLPAVWQIIENDLQQLKEVVQTILKKEV